LKMPIQKGNVVISKKGRDKGRYFVVLYTLDAVYAYLTDGDTRKLDHLKKKKLMHLSSVPVLLPEIVEKYEQHQLKDSDVRKALSAVRPDKSAECAATEQD
jgi:ribosomal protein L14E/L6E/L27E